MKQDILKFVAVMQKEFNLPVHHTASLCSGLLRLGRALDNNAVNDCNGVGEGWDKKREKIEDRIDNLFSDFGINNSPFLSGGDPRGCVLKIIVPSGYTDDWGREGVCVPYK